MKQNFHRNQFVKVINKHIKFYKVKSIIRNIIIEVYLAQLSQISYKGTPTGPLN